MISLYDIFIKPIMYETSHNIINITVYWLIFLGLIYLTYKLFKKMGEEFNFKLFGLTLSKVLRYAIIFIGSFIVPK